MPPPPPVGSSTAGATASASAPPPVDEGKRKRASERDSSKESKRRRSASSKAAVKAHAEAMKDATPPEFLDDETEARLLKEANLRKYEEWNQKREEARGRLEAEMERPAGNEGEIVQAETGPPLAVGMTVVIAVPFTSV